ncbi:MAG: carboxymuconolactone decarboxylase family protein [Deltaproteobacteria bacterium]|nr:MAG: carboxymuconolactone decarboxylase family protein [Deltaproteobacteria bacterium]
MIPGRDPALKLAIFFVVLAPALAVCAQSPAQPKSAAKTVSKTGIPYLPDNDQAGPPELLQAIRARRPNGKLLNLDRMLLHSPNFAKGWNGMFAAIRNQLSLPGKLRELAIMQIGVLNKADYEWIQHEPEYLKTGGSKEQLAALKQDITGAENDGKLFSEPERAVLALTREMTKNIDVSPATLKRVRSLLNDQQLIELIGTISGYNMVSRFAVATGLEVE